MSRGLAVSKLPTEKMKFENFQINDVIPLGAPPIHVTNQVIKCVWAHTKTQSFVAVVTMQFVR